MKQKESMEQLEQIIINNHNLTEAYRNLAKHYDTKTKFPILMLTLTEQETQIKALTKYFNYKNEIGEHLIMLEKLMSGFNPTESNDLLSDYQHLINQQASSLSLMRPLLTMKNNSSAGLHYQEDKDGQLISVTRCTCLPSPPSSSGLELR